MGQYCGFIIRINPQRNDEVIAGLINDGARDLRPYPELGLITGLMKGHRDGDAALKLFQYIDDASATDSFTTLGQTIGAPFDDRSLGDYR